MMALFVFAVFVLIVVAMLIWAVGYLDSIPTPPRNLIIVLIILIGAWAIANRAGIF